MLANSLTGLIGGRGRITIHTHFLQNVCVIANPTPSLFNPVKLLVRAIFRTVMRKTQLTGFLNPVHTLLSC